MKTNEPGTGQAAGPTTADLEQLVADLARPAGQLLSTLSTAAVALLRGLLDDAYQRGRADALAASRRVTMAEPNVVIHSSTPPGGMDGPAIQAEMHRRAGHGGAVRA